MKLVVSVSLKKSPKSDFIPMSYKMGPIFLLTALVNMSLFVFYVSLASSESLKVRNVVLDTISPFCLSIHILILDPTFLEGPMYFPSSSSGKGKDVVASG